MAEFQFVKTHLGDDWDRAVDLSPNGNIFLYSAFLRSLQAKVVVYSCLKKQEFKAGLVLVEDNKGQSVVLHNLLVYNGVFFAPSQPNQNNAQIISEQFKLLAFIAEQLATRYKNISLSLHPSVVDIRPFLWVNYGSDGPSYRADVRYTSYVNIADFAEAEKLEDIALYRNASVSRRQQIRYGQNKGVGTRADGDMTQLVDLYLLTMQRQDIEIRKDYLEQIKIIGNELIRAKMARVFISYTADGEIGSAALFGLDNKRGYYIWGANNPDLRDAHTGTAVVWDAFNTMSQDGVLEVDLEGVNSPTRGWFKLSFGGEIITYYHLHCNK